MCNEDMPVSVKVYYGQPTSSTVEVRRFVFRPEQKKPRSGSSPGIYRSLVERIRSVFNGLNLYNLNLCWKDDDGDYVVFSSDDELRVAISNTTDNTLRIYIREKQLLVHVSKNGDSNDVDLNGYARINKDPGHHRRGSSRSASVCPDSDISRRPLPHKDYVSTGESSSSQQKELSDHDKTQSNGTSELTSTNNVDSGTSTSSGIVEESGDTVKLSSNKDDPKLVLLCSECRGEGRRGILYQCTICQDYVLCSECENRRLHDEHIMLRICAGASQPISHR